MLTDIHIQGFKGFKDTKIGPLRKVNLILGGQNVGKTSLLEAVYAATKGSVDIGATFRVAESGDAQRFRDMVFGGSFLVIHILTDNDSWYGIEGPPIDFPSAGGHIHAIPIGIRLPSQDSLTKLLGKVLFARKKVALTDLLRKIDPRLLSIDAGSPDGEQRIYVELNDATTAIPLPQLGHGFSRLLHLYASLLVAESKLALIDEVENGIHYSALPVVMQGIKNIAQERDVQTLMTTHSWDCIRAACEVFADSPDDFQVIRLERTDDNVRAVCIAGEQLLRMVRDDMEVR